MTDTFRCAGPTKPMTQREKDALDDIRQWQERFPYAYTWKQASMCKLEARGLVRAVGMIGPICMWELTEAGKAHD